MTPPAPLAQTPDEAFRSALTALWEGQLPAALDVVESDPPDDRLEARFAVAFEADLSDEDYEALLDGLAGYHLAGAEAASELLEDEDEDEDAQSRLTGDEIGAALGRARLSASEAAPEMLRGLRDESSRLGARRTRAARNRGETIAEQRDAVEDQIVGWFRPGHDRGIQSRIDLEEDTRRVIQTNRGGLSYYSENRVANVIVSDGTTDAECSAANGQTWSLIRASANPLQHPNCVRSFEPAQRRRLAPTRATMPAMTCPNCRLPYLADHCDGIACAQPDAAHELLAERIAGEARVAGSPRAETDADGDSPVVIPLYGLIDDGWGIGLATIQRALTEANGRDVLVRVHSGGGNAFTGNAIYTALSEYTGRVTARIDGIAASAAAVAIMGADEIRMPPAASMMLHEAWVFAIGGRRQLLDAVRMLDGIDEQFAELVARRTNETSAAWRERLDGHDLWYSAREAVDAGLADAIDEPGDAPPPLEDAGSEDEAEPDGDEPALSALTDAALADVEALLHSR